MTMALQIGDGELSATVATLGAELTSLCDAQGREWLWQGDPASWPRQAPMLFPVVGRCAGGGVRHAGRFYPMPEGHGYAPRRDFAVIASGPTSCTLRLDPDDATRACFPFDIRLDVTFEIADGVLTQRAVVTNVGGGPGAASVGFHPGFQWPQPPSPGRAQTDYVVRFDAEETAPIRRIVAGRLTQETFANEVDGRTLRLRPELFARDAMVFDRIASRGVWFGAPGEKGVRVTFPDCPTSACGCGRARPTCASSRGKASTALKVSRATSSTSPARSASLPARPSPAP